MVTRRRTLLALGGTLLPLSGCIGEAGDDTSPAENTDDSGDDATQTDDDTNTNNANPGDGEGEDTPDGIEFDVLQLGTEYGRQDEPWWYVYDDSAPGMVELIDDEDTRVSVQGAIPVLRGGDIDLRGFIDDTDFEKEILLKVGTVGTDTCEDRIAIEDLRIEEDTLVGTASIEATDSNGVCEEATTFPWAFVRVETGHEIPSQASITITDGRGIEDEVKAPTVRRMDPGRIDGYVQPEDDPPAIPPALECDEPGVVRHTISYDDEEVHLGETSDEDGPKMVLRADSVELEYGETLDLSLRNVTERMVTTANAGHYSFELLTKAGWQDIRVHDKDDPIGYTLEGILHQPGEGFDWSFEMTEEGLGSKARSDLHVCPDLQTGRYRFFYWGANIAVEFDLFVD